ncbi:30S ribosomal protein S18 [bacterium]|jgi:small subunit ribosomal protein S18|nr:30S ribosomal protein S18 [bacterium]
MYNQRSRSFDSALGGKRRRQDPIAANKIEYIDFKDVLMLRKFLTDNGKILPARITGCSKKNQKAITTAVKRARAIGLLPYSGNL